MRDVLIGEHAFRLAFYCYLVYIRPDLHLGGLFSVRE